jgi:dTDP-glucose pyrophosphorylase
LLPVYGKPMIYYPLSSCVTTPDVGVAWPITGEPQLAAKDAAAKRLDEAQVFA